MTAFRTLCPSTKVLLSNVFDAPVGKGTLSEGSLSLPPHKGRLLGMSMSNCATLLLIMTPCSHRSAEYDNEKTYVLPDGNTTTVGAERVRYAEVLFPAKSHRKKPADSLTPLFQCFTKCAVATRKELYSHCRVVR